MKSITQLFLPGYLINSLIISMIFQAAYANNEKTQQKLLILGDSLSAAYGIKQGRGWVDLLQNKLSQSNKKIQIVNDSISGDTTANGLNRLPDALQQHQPAWVIIELGANDGLRGLSIAHIRNNLQMLIKSSLASGAEVLLMEIKIPPNYGKKYTRAFNRIYHKLAEQYDMVLLPFMLDEIAVKPELMQADGLHPNEQAQTIISENLWEMLEPVLREKE
ncbi:MAG: arylesterase [Gammaproteobacteria bacterium]|nr:MAG: arylesterase [Gammaproteobacteria bacterium]